MVRHRHRPIRLGPGVCGDAPDGAVVKIAFVTLLVAGLTAPALAAPPGPLCGAPLPTAQSGLFSGGFERPKIQHLASYCFDRHGMFTVVLDDGSIWRQWPGDVRYAWWRDPP